MQRQRFFRDAATHACLLFVFLSIAVIYKKQSGDWPYVLLAVGSFTALAFHFTVRGPIVSLFPEGILRFGTYSERYLAICWLPIVVSWIYGVGLGLVNEIPIKYVFRNFFGLNLYLLLPLLFTIRPGRRDLASALAAAAVIQSALAIIELLKSDVRLVLLQSLSDARVFYSGGLLVVFPFFTGSLIRLLNEKRSTQRSGWALRENTSGAIVLLALASFVVIVPPASKGFILAWLICLVFALSVSIIGLLARRRGTTRGLAIIVATMVAVGFAVLKLRDMIAVSFSTEEISNATRAEQLHLILPEIEFLGRGLGASLASGYYRDDSGYGLELTYLSLLHKLGIFAAPLLLSYVATYAVAISRCVRQRDLYFSAFAFGAMSFTIVGIGNPLLLSPVAVTLHCSAMYLLLQVGDKSSSDANAS